MVMTDPIADMLTRIRNALMAEHKSVRVPFSKIKEEVLAILKEEGYIDDYQTLTDLKQKEISVKLKYADQEEPVIKGIKRVSRPGLRVYTSRDEVPRVLNGMGIAILSTSSGILTDAESRKRGVGGEVLCYVW